MDCFLTWCMSLMQMQLVSPGCGLMLPEIDMYSADRQTVDVGHEIVWLAI